MTDMQHIMAQIDDLSLDEIETLKAYLEAQLEMKEAERPKKPFILGLHPGAISIGDDFNDPLPDTFWLGEE